MKERGDKFFFARLFSLYYNLILDTCIHISTERNRRKDEDDEESWIPYERRRLCQALNATMRGVAKGLYQIYKDEVEIIGFEDGYKGLMYANSSDDETIRFSGVLTKGGTMLGTSRQPFKLMRVPDENGLDKVELMKHTYYKIEVGRFESSSAETEARKRQIS